MKGFLGGVACLLAVGPGAYPERVVDIRMVRGERVFLRVEGVRTFAVSDPSVVAVSVKGNSLLMEAKSAGVCFVNVLEAGSSLRYRVVVDETSDLSKLAEKAQAAISSPHITVYGRGGKLVLEGRASSKEEARRAREIATTIWPRVETRIKVRPPSTPLRLGGKGKSPINPPREGVSHGGGKGLVITPADVGRRQKISLLVGMGKVITTKGHLKRVAVADEEICQPVIISAHQVFVVAKQPGVTSLYIWEEPLIVGGEVKVWEYEVEVRERKRNLRGELEETLREAGFKDVRVRFVEDKGIAILLGRVATEEEKRRAEAIATAFATNVVNMLEVEEPPPPPPPKIPPEEEQARKIKEAIGIPGVEVKVIGNTVVLRGEVETEEQKRRAEEVASLFGLKVVNQLTPKRPKRERQVQVEARVMELDWRWLRNLGLEWGTTDLFGYTRWFKYYRPGVVAPGVPGVPGVP
ncbi:MAG TPA: BON domain-containing protein, partial [Armatimonadetes bacterium]|nr:BON domain-containing protein [Armatimonadota bacterium]